MHTDSVVMSHLVVTSLSEHEHGCAGHFSHTSKGKPDVTSVTCPAVIFSLGQHSLITSPLERVEKGKVQVGCRRPRDCDNAVYINVIRHIDRRRDAQGGLWPIRDKK